MSEFEGTRRCPSEMLLLVAPDLRGGPSDLSLVRELLLVASGGSASATRSLTDEQIRALRTHRVVSLAPEAWTIGPDGESLAAEQRSIVATQLMLQAVSTEVVALLNDHAIQSRVLKGLATGELDYPAGLLRQSGDIDLLVEPRMFDQTIKLLKARGCDVVLDAASDTAWMKGLAMRHQTGAEIDVHVRLNDFTLPRTDLLWNNPEPLTRNRCALPIELRLIHAASHLVLTPFGHRRLSGLADLSAIVHRSDLDWGQIRKLAADFEMESIAGFGLAMEAALSGRETGHLEGWKSLSRFEASTFAGSRRWVLGEKILRVRRLPGARERMQYLRRLITPTRATRDYHGGILNYIRKAVSSQEA